jgi:hypothetical protein
MMKEKWKRLKGQIKFWSGVVLVGALLLALIWAYVSYEYGLWHECLTDHSWFYCHRVLS